MAYIKTKTDQVPLIKINCFVRKECIIFENYHLI